MNDTPSIPATTPPAPDARIDRDLYCVRCEYNLRTLTPDARCPECGLPVAKTLDDAIIAPRILRLRHYMLLWIIACGIGLAMVLIDIGTHLSYRLTHRPDVYQVIAWPIQILRWAIVLIDSYALLQLARRRMLVRGGSPHRTLRGALRFSVVLTLFTEFYGLWLVASYVTWSVGWSVFAYAAVTFIDTVFILLSFYYFWLLITPCPKLISRWLRIWGGVVILQTIFYLVLMLIEYFDQDFFWINSDTMLGDVINVATWILDLAVALVGVRTLFAIRRHLADVLATTILSQASPKTAESMAHALQSERLARPDRGGTMS